MKRGVAFYASVSFGKDSLAMLLLLLEKRMPLDEVIFYNSGMEFQAIYDIRDRIKPVLEQRGVRFTEVRPDVPFLYNMLERPVDSKKNGFHLGYSWCGGPCRWGTTLKTDALDGIALDADIHYDEEHEYREPQTKELVVSRVHGHYMIVPEIDGKLNCKKMSLRKNMIALNREIDTMTQGEYGCTFMSGKKTKSLKKGEELKQESENAELLCQIEQEKDRKITS